MQNFWIAALEYAGIWTHEQAEYVANNIKNSIHNEKYSEAFTELKSILDSGPAQGLSVLVKLQAEVDDLKNKKPLQTKK